MVLQNKIVEWTPREMFVFLLLINSCLLMFYVTKHISNHIIKHSQYFVFFIWIVSINISVTIVNIIWVFNSFCKDVQELETNFVLCFFIFYLVSSSKLTIYHIQIFNFFFSTYYVFTCFLCIHFYITDLLFSFIIVSI